jgi:CBS domain-containing protein
MPTVKDIMNTDVKTIKPDESVQKAAEIMKEFRIGSLIVITGTKLVGIITERDILNGVVAEDKVPSEVKVEDVMTREVIMVSPEMGIEEAVDLMMEKKIKKLPVVSSDKLIGIVTVTDIITAEPKMLKQLGTLMLFAKAKKPVAG